MTQSRNYRPRQVPDPPPAPEPLIAPTGNASLDVLADVVNKTAAPFQTAPPPEQGTLGVISHGLNAVLGVAGAPFELLDSGFAMATAGIAALVPGMPAATLTAPHLGTPHGHAHPPSLIPPAPPVPLPSIGTVAAAGCVSVLIGGLPSARASDVGPAPTCGSLGPIFEIYTGSSNTFIGGSRAARMTDITRHCNPASALGAFGKAMGAAGVVAGALGAGANAAGGAMAAAAVQAAQAAADAVALAMAAFLGKDPGIPPAMGAIMFGNPTVLIGGFPMPDTLELLGGLIKAAKKIGGAAKKVGKKAAKLRHQICLDPSEPVSLVTGEVYNDFEDAKIDPETSWIWGRHYRSRWAQDVGPMGRGFRHLYERRLELRRRRAVFVDYNGIEVDFPRTHDDAPYGGIAFGYVLEPLDPVNFMLATPRGERYRFQRAHRSARQARLVEVRPTTGAPFWLDYNRAGRLHRLWKRTLGGNIEARLRYDPDGCITAIERHTPGQAPVTLVQYAYDSTQCLVTLRNPYGAEYKYAYTAGRMSRAQDPRGYGFTWTYDHLGRCVACRGDDGLWGATLEYEVGRTLVTEADGGIWAYHYNDDGIITHIVDPLGGLQQYRTDERGLVTIQIDPAGLVTRWLYDRQDHHYGRIDPWGSLLPPENDDPSPATGRELFIPAEPRTMHLGRLQAFQAPPTSHPDLDAVAIPATLRPQVAAVLHASQRRPGSPTQQFDIAGRPVALCDVWGTEERTVYSPLGEPIMTIDADGRSVRREYGSWSLKLREADPSGAITQYAYDHREQIVAITCPRGHRVRYDRDACGRIEQIWNDQELEERYAHDAAGRVTTVFDGDGKPLVVYKYGAHGQCETRTQTSGEVHRYAYDHRGNICEASSATVEVKLAYDGDRRVVRDACDGIGIVHQFAGAKLRTSTFAGRFEIRYDDDLLGFIRITTPDGSVHRFRALPGGSIERAHSDGSHELSHYDGLGRCTGRYVWRDGQDDALWYARYRYSPAGDLQLAEDRFRGTTQFGYDAAHRLASIKRHSGDPLTIRHDPGGNVLQNSFYPWIRVDARNQLVEAPGEAFTYNRRYHLAEHRRSGSTVRYHYNSLDRLVRVTWNDGRPDWSAAYDGLGRRLYKEQDGQRTQFHWDGPRLAAEGDPNGVLRLYIYPTPDALLPIAFLDFAGLDAEPCSGRPYFIFYDQVGLPSHIHDASGSVVWLARHADPYGLLDLDPHNRIAFHLRFPGHSFDEETGLHYNRFRYYSPRLGRYLQSDPMGQGGGVNVYAYPPNPLVCVDVFGLIHRKKGKGKSGAAEASGPKKKTSSSEPEATSPSKKRGDHVFAHGLKKIPDELRKAADDALLPEPQQQRIRQAATEIDDALAAPAMAVTVDKGPSPAEGDAQSRDFGNARNDVREKQAAFIENAEDAQTARPEDRATAKDNLQKSADELNDAWKKMVDSAEDTDASKMVDKSDTDQGRDSLDQIRDAVPSMTKDIVDGIFPPG